MTPWHDEKGRAEVPLRGVVPFRMQTDGNRRFELALPMRIAIDAHRIDAVESVVMYFFTLLSAFDSVRCIVLFFPHEVTANRATGH